MQTLRARFLGAIAAGVALVPACRGQDPEPVAVPPAPTPSQSVVAAPPPAPAPEPRVAEPPPDPAPPPPVTATATASTPARATSCGSGFKSEKYCYVANKGPPRQIPDPTFTFDKKGCVPDDQVINTCEGVHAVISGPTVEGKNCCNRVCRGMIPPCGRPLLAADYSTRVAPPTARRDWLGAPVHVADAPPALASRLREAWLDDAAAEHASVAAFARFTLELLAVGAPALLVADAQRAGLDEIEHARICYALAAAYGGDAPVGPAPLSLSGVELRTDLAVIAAAAAEEACVGETFSACALGEARDGCTDPAVRELLGQMAEDEARHAELGFRFVAWAIARGGDEVRRAVRSAFDRALAGGKGPLPVESADPEAWRGAGRLPERDRAAAWRRATLEVLVPCRDRLLAREGQR